MTNGKSFRRRCITRAAVKAAIEETDGQLGEVILHLHREQLGQLLSADQIARAVEHYRALAHGPLALRVQIPGEEIPPPAKEVACRVCGKRFREVAQSDGVVAYHALDGQDVEACCRDDANLIPVE